MVFKILNGMAPTYIEDLFKQETTGLNVFNLRASHKKNSIFQTRTDYHRKRFAFTADKLWNALPNNLKEEHSLEVFKTKLRNVDLSIET